MEDYKKKYEEAMLRMNKWVEGSEITDPKEVAEFVFPELKESDEMVRKHLLKHFRNKTKEDWNGMPVKNILAWLEKHSEQKFKVGDWVVTAYGGTHRIEKIKNNRVYVLHGGCIPIEDIDHIWSIEDAKDGDVLSSGSNNPFIFSGFLANNVVGAYCGINMGGNFYIPIFNNNWTVLPVFPATKEQRDFLFSKMKEAGYEWDSEKKELKKIEQETELPNGEDYGIDSLYHAVRILEKTLGEVEGYQSDDGILEHKCAIEAVKRLYKQKPAWSEEDEDIKDTIIRDLKRLGGDIVNVKPAYKAEIDWLKSIKERTKGE